MLLKYFFLSILLKPTLSFSCEIIDQHHPCKDVSSNEIIVPNLLSQSQQDSIHELSLLPINDKCNNRLKYFLCLIYAPSCRNEAKFPIPPCRSLCETVTSDCKDRNIQWPQALNCDKFPQDKGDNKCDNGGIAENDYCDNSPKSSYEKSTETRYVCEDKVSIDVCNEFSNKTLFPNLANQTSQQVASESIEKIAPLIFTQCSSHIKLFICSIFFPKCDSPRPLPPCKNICESVRDGCESIMSLFRVEWPKEYSCDKFPKENCIGASEEIVTNDVIIALPSGGRLRGSTIKTVNNKHAIYAFQGIPYAEPPIAELRFKPPVAKRLTTNEPFDATKPIAECVQLESVTKTVTGDENCLILNVYTTHLNDVDKRPVMFFIHGGGFVAGSSKHYGPTRLLDYDVVLVTINYRLHILGFLSTNDEVSPGNYGLLDQLEALKWVQENIHVFGGDPNKVTIFGESAGSASVMAHYLSPLSQGMFHAAIAQSGTLLCPWAEGKAANALEWTKKIATDVGCPTTNNEKLVECLRTISAEQLTLKIKEYTLSILSPYQPVVDNNFLTDTSYKLLEKGIIANKKPLIMGVTKDEGLLFLGTQFKTQQLQLNDQLLQKVIAFTLNTEPQKVTQKSIELLKKEYFDSVDPTDSKTIRKIISQIFSDGIFLTPHYKTIQFLTQHKIEIFAYSFDLFTNMSLLNIFGIKDITGVAHTDDLFFLFSDRFLNEEINNTENTMLNMWTSFAEFSHPTDYLKNDVLKWPSSTKNNIQVYHLNYEFSVETHNLKKYKQMKFWLKDMAEAMEN